MIKLGFIGCGWIIEKAYLPCIDENKNFIVKSFFDSNIKNAERTRDFIGSGDVFCDIKQFLLSDIDAVIIATPNNTHSYYTNLVIKAKKHVLCEKPVSLLEKDVAYSLKLANDNNVVFLPSFANRFREDIVCLNGIISKIGKINYINALWKRKAGIPRPGTWITNKKMAGGGVLIDLGSHLFDIVLMYIDNVFIRNINNKFLLSQKPLNNSAQWKTSNDISRYTLNVETGTMGDVFLNDDVHLSYELNWDSDVEEDITEFQFFGSEGTICLNTLFGFSNNFNRNFSKLSCQLINGDKYDELFELGAPSTYKAFDSLLNYFYDAIKTRTYDYLKPDDCIDVVKLIEKIYNSNNII